MRVVFVSSGKKVPIVIEIPNSALNGVQIAVNTAVPESLKQKRAAVINALIDFRAKDRVGKFVIKYSSS